MTTDDKLACLSGCRPGCDRVALWLDGGAGAILLQAVLCVRCDKTPKEDTVQRNGAFCQPRTVTFLGEIDGWQATRVAVAKLCTRSPRVRPTHVQGEVLSCPVRSIDVPQNAGTERDHAIAPVACRACTTRAAREEPPGWQVSVRSCTSSATVQQRLCLQRRAAIKRLTTGQGRSWLSLIANGHVSEESDFGHVITIISSGGSFHVLGQGSGKEATAVRCLQDTKTTVCCKHHHPDGMLMECFEL